MPILHLHKNRAKVETQEMLITRTDNWKITKAN